METPKDNEQLGEVDVSVAPCASDKKVLYIEDSPANLRLMEKLLQVSSGCNLIAAETPDLGLELVSKHKPDLVLVDINLPGMSGYEVLRRLRANEETKGIPVIAVSANVMPEDIEKGLQSGFDDYITKPIDIKKFKNVVGQYLSV
jgi:CheY-like chemotaxis protein